MPWTTPITLTPCTQRQSFTVVSHTVDDGAPTPALLHRRWHAPNRSKVASASASTEVGSVTSVTTPMTSPPRTELVGRVRRAPSLDVGDDDLHPLGEERTRRAPARSRSRLR